MQSWHDWDSTVRCSPRSIEQPATDAEVVALVQRAIATGSKVRAFGAGHSWSPLVPTDGILINLDRLASPVSIDSQSGKATLQAGMRLRDAGPLLQKSGLTMANLGAITSQSIAGAIGSGTHGTGLAYGVLGTQVSAVKIVDGMGQLREFNSVEHPREMSALRLSLGCLGVIVEVTLDCEPDYTVKLDMAPMALDEFIREIGSLYTRNERMRAYWFPGSKQVYVHTLNKVAEPSEPGSVHSWFERVVVWQWVMGALWGTGRAINGLVPTCNRLQEMLGFRKDSNKGRCFDTITTPLPPFHQESEVAVPIEFAGQAIQEYGALVQRKGYRVNVPSEIRFSRSDDVLLSPGYGRDVCYIGGYNAIYKKDDPFFDDYCQDLRTRYEARPHWGKIGAPDRMIAEKDFPGFGEFEEIRKEFDPNGVFANEYIRELFAI